MRQVSTRGIGAASGDFEDRAMQWWRCASSFESLNKRQRPDSSNISPGSHDRLPSSSSSSRNTACLALCSSRRYREPVDSVDLQDGERADVVPIPGLLQRAEACSTPCLAKAALVRARAKWRVSCRLFFSSVSRRYAVRKASSASASWPMHSYTSPRLLYGWRSATCVYTSCRLSAASRLSPSASR